MHRVVGWWWVNGMIIIIIQCPIWLAVIWPLQSQSHRAPRYGQSLYYCDYDYGRNHIGGARWGGTNERFYECLGNNGSDGSFFPVFTLIVDHHEWLNCSSATAYLCDYFGAGRRCLVTKLATTKDNCDEDCCEIFIRYNRWGGRACQKYNIRMVFGAFLIAKRINLSHNSVHGYVEVNTCRQL